MEQPPRKSTTRDVLETVVETGVNLVPFVGGPAAVVIMKTLGWRFERRTQSWFEDLASAFDQQAAALDSKLSIEHIADNDVFVDAVIVATRAAQATHQEEKLTALRNGVLNSVGSDAPSADEQARFFGLVAQFTPSHLRLLKFLDDPASGFEAAGIPRPDYWSAGLMQVIEDGMPEFRGKRDWYTLIAADLGTASLLIRTITGQMTGSGLWHSSTSELGKRFLAFIGTSD